MTSFHIHDETREVKIMSNSKVSNDVWSSLYFSNITIRMMIGYSTMFSYKFKEWWFEMCNWKIP